MRGQQTDDNSIWIVIGGVLAFLAILWFWEKYSTPIYSFLLEVAKAEVIPFSSFPGMKNFYKVVNALDPSTMTFSDMNSVLNRAGRWYGWLLTPVMCFYIHKAWNMSARECFRRKLNMEGLLRNNAKLYPCIAPILNWGRSILKEPTDSGPWMVGRQPIQFVAANGLLKNAETGKPIAATDILGLNNIANPDSPVIAGTIKAKFDREGAAEAFKKQFSEEFRGLNNLPNYIYALAAAFLLFGAGRKEDGQKILDNMSLTFRPPQKGHKAKLSWRPPFYVPGTAGRKGYSISTKVHVPREEIKKIWKSEEVQRLIRPHNRYRNLVILTLYAFARKKGVISCAEFIWLRPVNRNLFYLLNNYGRRTAWVEVAGPWVHYEAEEILGNNMHTFSGTDIPLDEKMVEPAVNALEVAMFEEGWIHSLILDKKEYGLME